MALLLKERKEFFESISLGIDTCTDPNRISTLRINMQCGSPAWARLTSRVAERNEKKPKFTITKEGALAEVEKLVEKVKFGYVNIVIRGGQVVEVQEEFQIELWGGGAKN